MFALQQEQEKRRLGIFPPDQFMDEPLFYEGQPEAEATPRPDTRQTELEDAIELQRMGDEEASAETAARELRAASEYRDDCGPA